MANIIKKKILFIHHASGWGGAPNSMISLIDHLNKDNFEIKVLLLKNSVVADLLKQHDINFEIINSIFYKKYYKYFTHSEADYLKWHQIFKFFKHSFLWVLSRYYFAKRELKKQNFDLVHLNSSVLTDWLAPAHELGKTIIHIREPFRKGKIDLLHLFFKRQMRKYADHVIAISQDNATRVHLLDKTSIVYNNININTSDILDDSYASKKVLYLGGESKIKGFVTIADALDYLDKDVIILFAGDYSSFDVSGSLLKKIKQKIKILLKVKYYKRLKKIHNHPNAFFIGLTYDVDKYLSEVCCLVSPFSYPHFSRPIIESYLHKKTVIATDVHGMEEIIKENITGVIVQRKNPMALATAINNLSRTPELAKKMGEAGYIFAKDKLNSYNYKKIESIYNFLK
jgi:glycosyltransferase involved in cell wall biosynthesis